MAIKHKTSEQNYDLQISITRKIDRHNFAYCVSARTHTLTSFSSGLFTLKITLVAMNGHNCVCVYVCFFSPLYTVRSTVSK